MRSITLKSTFLRFLLVGVINTAVGLGIMLGLLNLAGLGYWPSTLIGHAVGACVSYILNRSYTFRSDVHWLKGFLLFSLVVLTCYFISYGLGMAIVERALPILFPHAGSRLIENVAVVVGMGMYTVLNFLAQQRFVFRTVKRSAEK